MGAFGESFKFSHGDGGVIFNSVFDDYCQSIGCVALDPKDPDNVIWVGTGEVWTRNSTSIGDGIYRSGDGGKSWKKMGLEKSDRISDIRIHPENPNLIYVGVQGALWGPSEDRGIYNLPFARHKSGPIELCGKLIK